MLGTSAGRCRQDTQDARPPCTKDLKNRVEPTHRNAERVWKALVDLKLLEQAKKGETEK